MYVAPYSVMITWPGHGRHGTGGVKCELCISVGYVGIVGRWWEPSGGVVNSLYVFLGILGKGNIIFGRQIGNNHM